MTPEEQKEYKKQYYRANKEKWRTQYAYTPASIERRRKYNLTDASRASKRKYNKGESGRQAQAKYRKTDKFKRDQKKYYEAHKVEIYRRHKDDLLARLQKWRFKRFGITEAIYNHMMQACNYACEICLRKFEDTPKGAFIDHCHKTGKVRGLLCFSCNTAEGHLRADPEIIYRLYEYVKKHAS